jgi:chromosome segregation ATPase
MGHVDREAVFDAARGIRDRGERPSVRAVLAALGSGSSTTVHKYLREWQQQEEAKKDRPAMPSTVREAAEQLWAAALEAAQEELQEAWAQLQTERSEHEVELGQLRDRLQQSEQQRRDLEAQLQSFTEAQEALRGQLRETEQALAQAGAHEQAWQELGQAHRDEQREMLRALQAEGEQRIEALRQETAAREAEWQRQLEAQRSAHAEALEQQRAWAEAQIAFWQHQAEACEAAHREAKAASEAKAERLAALNGEVEAAQAELTWRRWAQETAEEREQAWRTQLERERQWWERVIEGGIGLNRRPPEGDV